MSQNASQAINEQDLLNLLNDLAKNVQATISAEKSSRSNLLVQNIIVSLGKVGLRLPVHDFFGPAVEKIESLGDEADFILVFQNLLQASHLLSEWIDKCQDSTQLPLNKLVVRDQLGKDLLLSMMSLLDETITTLLHFRNLQETVDEPKAPESQFPVLAESNVSKDDVEALAQSKNLEKRALIEQPHIYI